MLHGHVRPVVPRRDTYLLGYLVNAVNGAAHVRPGDDKGVLIALNGTAYRSDDIGLILPFQGGNVDHSFGGQPAYERAADGAGDDGTGPGGGRFPPADPGEVLAQRLRCDEDARLVRRVRHDRYRHTALNQ